MPLPGPVVLLAMLFKNTHFDERGKKLSFLRAAVGRRAAVAVSVAGASIDQPPPTAAPTFPTSCAFIFDKLNLKQSDEKNEK